VGWLALKKRPTFPVMRVHVELREKTSSATPQDYHPVSPIGIDERRSSVTLEFVKTPRLASGEPGYDDWMFE